MKLKGLMAIIGDVIERELDELNRNGVQLRHLGHLEGLNPTLRQKVLNAVEVTKNNSRLVLSIAFNYGGRDEIVCAVRQIISEGFKPEDVTEELISQHMFSSEIPDPDFVVRTSGEMRTSNFLVWQSTYAEWYFTDTLWPDFDKEELRKALLVYCKRERRFGKVSSGEC